MERVGRREREGRKREERERVKREGKYLDVSVSNILRVQIRNGFQDFSYEPARL